MAEFIVENPPEDLGKLRYEYDDGKTVYDGDAKQTKHALRSFAGIYLTTLCALLTVWFVYAAVFTFRHKGVAALAFMLPTLLVMCVIFAIVGLSVTGGWGKLLRFGLKHGAMRGAERANAQAMVDAAERNRGKENAFRVYDAYAEVVNRGERKVLDRAHIRKIKALTVGANFRLAIWSDDGEIAEVSARPPREDLCKLARIFGDVLETVDSAASESARTGKKTKDFEKYEGKHFDGNRIGGFCMGLFAAAVGVVLILLHYRVQRQVPVPLGIIFVLAGILACFTTLDFVPVIKIFVIPCFFGILFFLFPPAIALSVLSDSGLSASALGVFASTLSPITAAGIFFMGLGLFIAAYSVTQLYAYLGYRLRRDGGRKKPSSEKGRGGGRKKPPSKTYRAALAEELRRRAEYIKQAEKERDKPEE